MIIARQKLTLLILTGRTTITIAHRLSTVKDADCIYVMGGGLVLEKGKHDDLLRNEDGPYARLVAAQKLRDTQEPTSEDSAEDESAVGDAEEENFEKTAEEEIPLERRRIRQSLASAILSERRHGQEALREKKYSMTRLFARMGNINRDERMKYVYGCIFAASTCCSSDSQRIVSGFGWLISQFSQ